MKKLLATVVALSCATVMLLGTAFADKTFIDGIGDTDNIEAGEGSWAYKLDKEGAVKLSADDCAKIDKITITFTASSLDAGFGGGFIVNSGVKDHGWDSVEWGNADAGKPISAVPTDKELEFTITREGLAGCFGNEDSGSGIYNNICLQSWWGADITVTKLECFDASGNVIFSAPSSGSDTPAPTPDDNPEPTPVTGDVMNVVMIAGVAVVALGGVVVCARKKNA
ncbi:MAG: hypothetical protein Q4C48_01440 [Lachnospiraceae bacterium]|nr:hypothetical protein [Lachnospiraceae bacterium]